MIRKILVLLVLLSACWLAIPRTAAAFDPFGGVDCSGSNAQSAVCTDSKKEKAGGNQDPVAGHGGLLSKVTSIMALIAGIAAVIVILIGSINYLTADGDASKAASARNTVVYALVGLVVIILVRTIIVFVVQKLS